MTTSSITADAIKALFPHPTLRPTEKLTNDVILEWFIQTRQNLSAIDSMLGGGQNGLLGLTMTPVYYQQRYGVKFIVPPDPGVTQYAQGATATDMANQDNIAKAIKEERAKVKFATTIVINQFVNACLKSTMA